MHSVLESIAMKRQKLEAHLYVALLCAWVLWTNAYTKAWQPYGEFETLSACEVEQAKWEGWHTRGVMHENEEMKKLSWRQWIFSTRIFRAGGTYKCMPAGTAPSS